MKSTHFFIILLSLFSFSTLAGYTQSTSLVFFSEQGERFSVILNGILQNPKPETNIRITDLPAPSYKVRILFEDSKLTTLDKTVFFGQGTETTYCIKKNNKGEYVIRYQNEVPLAQAPPPAPAQTVILYTNVPAEVMTTTTTTSIQAQSTTTGTTIQTGVSASGNGETESAVLNIAGGEISASAVTTTSSVQTTQTTTTQTSGQGTVKGKPVYAMPGYSGPVGCPYPITDLDFRDVKNSIASKSFEDSKLTIAKQVTSANCLFASEVKQILELFSFETTRLEFAKFAYPYTYDQGNYYKLNDAFKFESSIEELNDFISGNRH